jgi:hypothetical protein
MRPGTRIGVAADTARHTKNVDASNISSVARSGNRTVVSIEQITVCGTYTKVWSGMSRRARERLASPFFASTRRANNLKRFSHSAEGAVRREIALYTYQSADQSDRSARPRPASAMPLRNHEPAGRGTKMRCVTTLSSKRACAARRAFAFSAA